MAYKTLVYYLTVSVGECIGQGDWSLCSVSLVETRWQLSCGSHPELGIFPGCQKKPFSWGCRIEGLVSLLLLGQKLLPAARDCPQFLAPWPPQAVHSMFTFCQASESMFL